ncbi:MAG TPA: cyclic nucleotide-binding domain-containing protein, partial [Chthonomonadaceae bacterium]|nr:cyclic nucleotide-binding domain-containing protein [Chthonomonadaceae bacterium]
LHPANPAMANLLPALPGTDWGYYLSGDWTRDPTPWRDWLAPGLGFHGLPAPLAAMPTLLAAPLTLVICGLASYVVFAATERIGTARGVRSGRDREAARDAARHVLFSIAGFAGFLIFYQFAGAPTFAQLPFGLYGGFRIAIAIFATTVLITRLRRTRARQLQYDQARKWLQRWPLRGVPPPEDLEEAYRLVTEHLRTSEERMRLFQITIQGMLADNLLTATEIGLLDRMAADLGLGEDEKKKVVRHLSSQYPGLFTGTLDDALRLLGYRGELERSISENRGVLPEETALRTMQARYRIQPDEHEAVLRELRDPNSSRTEHLRREVEEQSRLAADVAMLSGSTIPAIRFLHHELSARLADERDHILEIANLYGTAGELTGLAAAIRQGDAAAIAAAVEWVGEHLPETVAGMVADAIALRPAAGTAPASEFDLLRVLLDWSVRGDVIQRAAAIYGLSIARDGDPGVRASAAKRARAGLASSEPLLREAAVAALAPDLTPDEWRGALTDASTSVRRSAILRVPAPLGAELAPIVRQATEDRDPIVRSTAIDLTAGLDNAAAAREGQPAMTVLQKMFALRALQLLANIPDDALCHLAERAEEQVFRQGSVLCVEGETGDDVFLVLEGETEAVRGSGENETRLGLNRPGETVGEMGILDPAPRMATVRPVTPFVRVLTVHGPDFRALLARDTSASMGIIRLLIQRQRGAQR